jgi:capsule polysaccharide export protein KpsE/RkpR
MNDVKDLIVEAPVSEPLRYLARRWRTVAISAAVGLAGSVAYFMFAPRIYEAQLTLVPLQQSRSLGASMLGQGASILGELGIGAALGGSSGYRIAGVLQSRSVTDSVIHKLDLLKKYEVAHLEQARKQLWTSCSTSVDKRSDLVAVTCQDKNPELARDIAHYVGEYGNEALRRVSTSTAGEERRFLEKQVQQARDQVETASKELRTYQEKHQIVDLGEQAKGVVSEIASLEGQRVSKQLELSYMRSFASPQEANVAQLESQLRIMEAKLRELANAPAPKTGTDKPTPVTGLFPSALDLPKIRYEIEQLAREQKVREAIYLVLTERLEIARADEVREASAFQILDEPDLPTYRVWPRGRVLPMGLLAGLAFGIFAVLVPAWWRGLRQRVVNERPRTENPVA